MRLLLSRFALVGQRALALQRAPKCDQYCRAAEPLAVRRKLIRRGRRRNWSRPGPECAANGETTGPAQRRSIGVFFRREPALGGEKQVVDAGLAGCVDLDGGPGYRPRTRHHW